MHEVSEARDLVLPTLATLALLAPPAAAMPPQTTVELRVTSVDDGAAKLHEQALLLRLGDRLLEDGHRVVPAGRAAGVRVWVHLEIAGATIETRGTTHRIETVAGGDPALVSLEIQQLTTALVDEVQPNVVEPQPAVVLEVSGAATDPELRERLQRGLLARGLALTRRPTADDRRLCVAVTAAGEAQVHVVAGDEDCMHARSTARVPAGETLARGRELLLDVAAAQLDAWAPPASAPAPSPPPDEPARPLPPADDPRAPALTLALHGGFLGRTGGPVDGLVGLGARFGRRRGVGGGIECTLVPSRAEGLRVIEAMPTLTFDWRIGVGARGMAALGLFAGVHLHRYAQTGPTGETDTRVGTSAGATVRLGWLARRGALLFAGLRAGWSGGRWVHLHDGNTSWRRSALMLGLELGAGWDFSVSRRGRR